MQNLRKSHPEPIKKSQSLQNGVIDFITAGIGCNCLITLYESGALNNLINNGFLSNEELEGYNNPLSIKAALLTLEKCKIIKKKNNHFQITEFGRAISEYMGLITMLFEGYGDLMAQQAQVTKGKVQDPAKLIRGPAVSRAAVLLSKNTIDPILIKEFEDLNFSGSICDLGCGYGRMLSKVCEKTGNPGLGFDSEPKVVEQAEEQFEKSNITIELADISKLEGIWEDVVILMQCHVFHDFTPEKKCINIMNSYLNNFPNLKYFFFVDTVAPSSNTDEILPGFDYVHGLLGISPRTYEETLHMFDHSNFRVIKEVPIPGLPKTFLWLLSPKREFNHRRREK